MSKKHLSAAVLVSIGCSVAFRDASRDLYSADDVLQLPNAPGQPINARDHQNVALAQEVQDERAKEMRDGFNVSRKARKHKSLAPNNKTWIRAFW